MELVNVGEQLIRRADVPLVPKFLIPEPDNGLFVGAEGHGRSLSGVSDSHPRHFAARFAIMSTASARRSLINLANASGSTNGCGSPGLRAASFAPRSSTSARHGWFGRFTWIPW